ncbi:glycoside hydrolase family 76 protein [Chitinophaga sp. sic0106]|uniref:glycoside hydrolase family 76 protein n=1 Tax=Chitinophaga sp. sic0106 TaxID=2854785 RepID=UPI001C4931D2|nr:glycoside hydrolase family 76 protein [Chitinophaga sp. sic0106]MBV7530618.1 glycoside hydrolase family 76 protein [Chitinophaga sp. sic0106]
MKVRKIRLTLCCLLAAAGVFAQSNRQRAEMLQQAIDKYLYEPQTGLYIQTSDRTKNHNLHADLWGLCALIQAANEMERMQPAKSYMPPVVNAIQQYYDPIPPAPGYASYVVKERREDRYFDDNQWIGIAYLDAYTRTGKKWYLEKGEEIYRFMMTGYDTITGGGLYWKERDLTTKNTCSNGPGILLALQLYESTRHQPYLDTALLLYNWVNRYLRSPDAIYWDAIKPAENNRIDSAAYTYNTGTMLEANVKLYQLTKEERYLKEAKQIANGSYRHFFRNGRFPSSYWFNAVLLRGYEALYKVDHHREYIQAMQAYADKVWEKDRDPKTSLLGNRPEKELLGQAGMMEIYARLALIK